ncbi:RNA polymerase factor sigma-54 [Aquirufa ecclesiirivi]|uniref:RNA polymerase factor sigma-54 n=1 Tax=Aquirufa ecclesiirivi TaxID=2715124 RepID=UPI0022A86CB7|nr:RNA polymerase factor sigma-54 [Aquirufa ecclesiirivi]MCZ2472803.1 RNA polymerase factor sigma-54 [Aquirufa ecclesiirivi]
MQGLSLKISQQQRLSPQQIQFVKLLQIPTAELAARIEEELEENPALEEGVEIRDSDEFDEKERETVEDLEREELEIGDYLQDDYAGYKMAGDSYDSHEESKERPMATVASAEEYLLMQIGFVLKDEREEMIAHQLIGSLEEDGYLRRNIESIVNDLAFTQGFNTDFVEVENVLKKIQVLDPAGIGARDLQECLSIQLHRRESDHPTCLLAIRLIDEYFDEFSKKHFVQLQQKLGIDESELKKAINLIKRLNPKPGGAEGGNLAPYLQPDFVVTNQHGKLDIKLNGKNAPELRVSKSFQEMLQTYDQGNKQQKEIKEAVTFIKHKLDAASWFIQAIQQRQGTLLKTMHSIVAQQYDFFLTGDDSSLKPMKMKEIAALIEMDVSTVSRVVSAKSVQTDFGIYPLKYFFSEGITHESGEDVSTREVKNILRDIIEQEPAHEPYPDETLELLLAEKGFVVKRRTVAKYREQLGIPVARLRKNL